MGHAGPVANARSNGAPRWPRPGLSPLGSISRELTDADIARITDDYRHAARMVVDAGFDSIEVHLGHNYLLSAFLSPKLNRRATSGAAASRTVPASPARSSAPCGTRWAAGPR